MKHEDVFVQPTAALICSKKSKRNRQFLKHRSFGTVSEAIRPLICINTAAHPTDYHAIKLMYVLYTLGPGIV
jgi:hypothetical protein